MKDISIEKLSGTITVTVHMNDIRNIQITNADRIRAMTDEELAWFLWNCAQPCCPPINCAFKKCGAEKCWFSWLKSPAEEGGDAE